MKAIGSIFCVSLCSGACHNQLQIGLVWQVGKTATHTARRKVLQRRSVECQGRGRVESRHERRPLFDVVTLDCFETINVDKIQIKIAQAAVDIEVAWRRDGDEHYVRHSLSGPRRRAARHALIAVNGFTINRKFKSLARVPRGTRVAKRLTHLSVNSAALRR